MRIIEIFFSIASPLMKLTKKMVKFLCSGDCEGCFENLKDKLNFL